VSETHETPRNSCSYTMACASDSPKPDGSPVTKQGACAASPSTSGQTQHSPHVAQNGCSSPPDCLLRKTPAADQLLLLPRHLTQQRARLPTAAAAAVCASAAAAACRCGCCCSTALSRGPAKQHIDGWGCLPEAPCLTLRLQQGQDVTCSSRSSSSSACCRLSMDLDEGRVLVCA
jgi:hypothetical protein